MCKMQFLFGLVRLLQTYGPLTLQKSSQVQTFEGLTHDLSAKSCTLNSSYSFNLNRSIFCINVDQE